MSKSKDNSKKNSEKQTENQVEALLQNIDKDLLLKLLDALVIEQTEQGETK